MKNKAASGGHEPEFLGEDFLLQTEPARRLYHDYARDEPILDYHCHLPPEQVASDHRFSNLTEIWLGGDHYKWRAMRANGVSEEYCTGNAAPYEKFKAFCETVPHTLRNPLYHWSHLELRRYFGISLPINGETAPHIWEEANERLAEPDFSARSILRRFQVRLVGTTDDPTDSLQFHQQVLEAGLPEFRMIPTFRLDRGTRVDQPEQFCPWMDSLETAVGRSLPNFDAFLGALKERHDFFHDMGARSSDHGLDCCPCAEAGAAELDRIYRRAREGQAATPHEQEQVATHLLRAVGRWNTARGWVMQLHLGAMRNTRSRLFLEHGPDTGFDSIGDQPQGERLRHLLNSLDETNSLPKVIFYNLNPRDNYLFASMAGNFQGGSMPGKIQFGSGWWFLDQKEAMEWQLNALSNNGLLSRFVGMLTDSRSFMSYCRHEYFRRVLCNLLGQDMADGLLPMDYELCGGLVRNVSYRNAKRYFLE